MSEPLAVLLLPAKLDEFELAAHARELLRIPRVLALEPGRFRTPRWLRDTAPLRAARRLRLPGEPRVLVLYHPEQYPLARALGGRYEQAELWYVRPAALATDPAADDLAELDLLASERATPARLVNAGADLDGFEERLRQRLRELEVISSRPFVPGARVTGFEG